MIELPYSRRIDRVQRGAGAGPPICWRWRHGYSGRTCGIDDPVDGTALAEGTVEDRLTAKWGKLAKEGQVAERDLLLQEQSLEEPADPRTGKNEEETEPAG